jgi:hypothetical protein
VRPLADRHAPGRSDQGVRERAAFAMCAWVESGLGRFRLGPPRCASPAFEEVKPGTELLAVLYALAGPAHLAARSPLAAWAARVGWVITCDAEGRGAHLDGEALRAGVRGGPSVAAALLAHLLRGEVTGRPCAYRDRVVGLLAPLAGGGRDAQGPPDLDLAFTLDLAGLADCRPAALRALPDLHGDPSTLSSSALYDATHAVFYATRFGRRPTGWPAHAGLWLRAHLGPLSLARTLAGDRDLGAELLLAWLYSGASPTREALAVARHLAEASLPGGRVAARCPAPGADEFEVCYHATLVCLAAVAEVSARTGDKGHRGELDSQEV